MYSSHGQADKLRKIAEARFYEKQTSSARRDGFWLGVILGAFIAGILLIVLLPANACAQGIADPVQHRMEKRSWIHSDHKNPVKYRMEKRSWIHTDHKNPVRYRMEKRSWIHDKPAPAPRYGRPRSSSIPTNG